MEWRGKGGGVAFGGAKLKLRLNKIRNGCGRRAGMLSSGKYYC